MCTPPLSTTCSADVVLLDQVDLPVRLLDPDAQVPDLPGDVVGLAAQLGDREGGRAASIFSSDRSCRIMPIRPWSTAASASAANRDRKTIFFPAWRHGIAKVI